MRTHRSVSALILSTALFLAGSTDGDGKSWEQLRIESDPQSAQLTILHKDRPVLIYAHSARQFKPYIKALFDLSGYNVLLDAPSDHLHHHGIMYAVMVNGINYWQERDDTGIQRSLRIEEQRTGVDERGLPYASFVDVIEWLDLTGRGAAEGGEPLLHERRTITVTVDDKNREVAAQWSADFVVGSRVKSAVLTGDPYNGLGLRLSRDFDSRVVHRNAEKTLDPRRGDPNILKARWSAASVSLPARDSTVAVFGDQANRLGDPVFFLMYQPFAYISATQALDKGKLEYESGAHYRLNYLVTTYPEIQSSEFLRLKEEEWERTNRSRMGSQ
ncbi:MAG: PmoA family protein [Nitrospira sp.]|nr:PmoA family protein [Nitrospira sp.]